MKYIYLVLLLIGFAASAQFDTGNSIAIPRAKKPPVAAKPTPSPSIPSNTPSPSPFSLEPDKEPAYLIGSKQKTFSMVQEDKFVNRSSEFIGRTEVKKRGENTEAYKGNQDFGQLKTSSQFVQILCRDFAAEDGDRIKILVNDKVVMSDITLTNDFKGVQITLEPGFNKVEFEALNQGTSGPNTAEFKVFDDKEKLISSNEWNLATGFKARILVVKE